MAATEQAKSQLHFAPKIIENRSLAFENESFEVGSGVSKTWGPLKLSVHSPSQDRGKSSYLGFQIGRGKPPNLDFFHAASAQGGNRCRHETASTR